MGRFLGHPLNEDGSRWFRKNDLIDLSCRVRLPPADDEHAYYDHPARRYVETKYTEPQVVLLKEKVSQHARPSDPLFDYHQYGLTPDQSQKKGVISWEIWRVYRTSDMKEIKVRLSKVDLEHLISRNVQSSDEEG